MKGGPQISVAMTSPAPIVMNTTIYSVVFFFSFFLFYCCCYQHLCQGLMPLNQLLVGNDDEGAALAGFLFHHDWSLVFCCCGLLRFISILFVSISSSGGYLISRCSIATVWLDLTQSTPSSLGRLFVHLNTEAFDVKNQLLLVAITDQSTFRAISELIQSTFRAISEEQFQKSSFRAISEQFQSNSGAISEQFLKSSFRRAVSEQLQSSFRKVVSEQVRSRFRALSKHFRSSFGAVREKQFQSSFGAVSEQADQCDQVADVWGGVWAAIEKMPCRYRMGRSNRKRLSSLIS